MLEMLLCSSVTLLPDYLYRRYVQGKRIGKEITFYSVWFELRWGITSSGMSAKGNNGMYVEFCTVFQRRTRELCCVVTSGAPAIGGHRTGSCC